MSTGSRGWTFAIVLIAAAVSAHAGRSLAADGPSRFEPIPAPMGEGQSQESYGPDDSVVADDCGTDFCGLSVCSPPGRFWMRADYLMWWTSGMNLPPLVTTSPQDTPRDEAGILGSEVLYGDDTVNDGGRSGFRTTLGMWIDPCHRWGVEFDYLNLGERASNYSQYSDGDPILARPFYNLQPNEFDLPTGPASELVAFGDETLALDGTVSVVAKDYFQSAGVVGVFNLCSCDSCCDPCGDSCGDGCGDVCGVPMQFCCRTDLLAGFRYYSLSDQVGIREDLRAVFPETPLEETTFDIHDNFKARNDFYGSEFGLRTQLYRGRWSLEILTKIALGNTRQKVTIDGQTIVRTTGQSAQTYDTGILAGPDNTAGSPYQRDVFTMIPQLGLDLGYQVNCHWRAFVGYNILYWGSVWRAGDQIDLNLDPRNFPPATGGYPFPAFPGYASSFWAQGLNLGTEFRF